MLSSTHVKGQPKDVHLGLAFFWSQFSSQLISHFPPPKVALRDLWLTRPPHISIESVSKLSALLLTWSRCAGVGKAVIEHTR